MQGREVASGELKRRLNEVQRVEVDRHLSEGLGVALYEDSRGRPILVVPTGGGRGHDIPGFPPAMYGGGTLAMFVPPQPKARPLGSQYSPPPQIARPRVSPTSTEYPDVRITMREGPHPRGHSAGFINPERLLPSSGREPEQVVPPAAPLPPDVEWWTKVLRS
jgi:hypothetical protein